MSAVEIAGECSVCGMPAVEQDNGYAHAEMADAVFCSILRGASPAVTEDDE